MSLIQKLLKREHPEHASRDELARIVGRVKRIATLMDSAVGIPGTKVRVGWDSLIGLLPGVGDFVSSMPLVYYIWVAYRFKLGPKIWMRLLANQSIDFLVGSIPLIGDIFDVGFKSNKRNADILSKQLKPRIQKAAN